jgi:guanylate kinase
VITGPSGVGKGKILEQVFESLDQVTYSVSATTRPRRPGEQDGQNYHFKTREEFETMIEAGELLEWAEFVGNLYGTPRQPVLDTLAQGMDLILEIEVQGAKQVREKMPGGLFFFISPPSLEILEQRLYQRSTEAEPKIQARLQKAREELTQRDDFDYQLVNHDNRAQEVAQQIVEIVESHRRNSDLK